MILLQPHLEKLGIKEFEFLGLFWFSTTHFLIALKIGLKAIVLHVNSPSKTENVFLNCLETLTGHCKPELVQQYLFRPLNPGLPFVLCLWSYDSEDLCLIQMPAEGSTEVPKVSNILPLPCSHTVLGLDVIPFILDKAPQILCTVHTSANVSLVTVIRPKDDTSKEFLTLYAKSFVDSLSPPAFKPLTGKMKHLQPTEPEPAATKPSFAADLKPLLPSNSLGQPISLFPSTTVAQTAGVLPPTNISQVNQILPTTVAQPTSVLPPTTVAQAKPVPEVNPIALAPKPLPVEKVIHVKYEVPRSLCKLMELFTEAVLKERVSCGKTWQQLNDLLNKNGEPSLCKINQTQAAIQTVFQFLAHFRTINEQFHLASTEIRTDCVQTIGFLAHLTGKIDETLSEKNFRKEIVRKLCPEAEHNLRSVKTKSKNVDNSFSQIEAQLKELNEQFSRLMKAGPSLSQNQANVSQILQTTLSHNWKLLLFERSRVAKLFSRLELNEAEKSQLCSAEKEAKQELIMSLDKMQLGPTTSAKEQALLEQDSRLFEMLFPKSKWKVNIIKAPKILSEKVVLVPKTPLQKTKSRNLPPVRSPGKIFTNDLNLLGYISPISSQEMGPQFESPLPGQKDTFKFESMSVPEKQKPSSITPTPVTTSPATLPKPVAKSIFEQKFKDITQSVKTTTGIVSNLFGKSEPQKPAPASEGLLATATTSSGGLFASTQPSTQTPSLFPASQPSSGLFSSNQTTSSTTSLFPTSKPTGGLFDSPTSSKPEGLFGTAQQTSTTGTGLFPSPQKMSTNNLGLFTSAQQVSTKSPGLFGSPQQTATMSSSLFPQQTTAPSSGGLFGAKTQATEQKPETGGLFATPQSPSKPSPGIGLFGATSQQPSGKLFESATATSSVQPQTGGLFGSNADKTNQLSSLFGQATGFGSPAPNQSSENVFAKASSKDSNAMPGLFGENKGGGGLFGTLSSNQQVAASTNGWFGNNQSSKGLFSNNTTASSGSLFGTQSAFGALAANNPLGGKFPFLWSFILTGMTTSPQSNSVAQGGLFGGFQSSTSSGEGLFSSLAKQAGHVNTPLQPPVMGTSSPSFTQRRA
ncbi:hypothetical protein Ciccas_005975 [Cichlidogyrus casuarinus]|uniref:Nuclear pore complex protein Nup214 n=1 Tax=Cichlidogyrus casuarinus TaxID=1844966 RepID=A0ABD2Q748_9PLAT